MSPGGPLDGVRVLDFSRVLAGPSCGRALADLGADVVKIEPPDGDLTRFFLPRHGSMSLYFAQQNAGKRNISLDLTHPEATALLLRLCEGADVVLENFRPGVMARMGLGYDAVSAVNPRIVYGSITGYGQDGPWSQRRAYAQVIHAEAGMVAPDVPFMQGRKRGVGYSHADVYAGLECLAGLLAALYARERTGEGQHVDVAMVSAMLNINERIHLELGVGDPTRLGPFGPVLFETGEGHHVSLSGDPVDETVFRPVCVAMDRPELRTDERFADPLVRRQHAEELYEIVEEWMRGFTDLEELEAALAKGKMPLGVVRSVAEVAESPWAEHRGAIVHVSDRTDGTIAVPQAAWRFSSMPVGVAGDPAWRGEHNREVFAELGLSAADLDRLEAEGVLSSRVPATG